ncbi:hypothetical protein IWW54_006676, partial [Coemansia sp. RSA 2705]
MICIPKALRLNHIIPTHSTKQLATSKAADMPPIKPTLSREAKNATRGKKGKSFTTKNSMLDILDQVNQAEEARVNKKLERQHTIKKLVDEREVRTAEKKKKKTSRL